MQKHFVGCTMSCRVRLYVYVYAYVDPPCLPNLPNMKLCVRRSFGFVSSSRGFNLANKETINTTELNILFIGCVRKGTFDSLQASQVL